MRRLVAFIACMATAAAGAAQSAPAPLPAQVQWAEVLRLVHERSPLLVAIVSQNRVAQAEIGVAGVRPNPELSYTGFGRLGSGDNYGTQHQIGFAQPLWLAGQRSARVRSAERRAEAVRAETFASEMELGRASLHAFIVLLAAQTRLAELTSARGDVANVAHTVHERVNAGAESDYDAARVDLEGAQLEARVAEATAEVIDASTSFAEVLGIPDWQPRAAGLLEPLGLETDFTTLWQRAERSLPSLVASERRVTSARSEIDVARAERWGELTLSGGTFLTSDKGSVSAFLGLAAPLPLWNFGGAAIDRAQASLARAQAEHDAARAQAKAALSSALSTLLARRTALAGYDSGVIHRLPGLRDMAENAYKSGRASLLELLDSVRSSIEVRLGRVELVGNVRHAELDVLVAAGLLHTP